MPLFDPDRSVRAADAARSAVAAPLATSSLVAGRRLARPGPAALALLVGLASTPGAALASDSPAAPPAKDAAAPPRPRVVITEIMYNPASKESRGEPEWVEIANLGAAPVELRSWRLTDEPEPSGSRWGSFSCTLAPGAVAVLVNAAHVDEAAFRAAWDPPSAEGAAPTYLVIPVKWGGLANAPDPEKSPLTLRDGDGAVVCSVGLRNGDEWPKLTIAGGPSIYLADPAGADPDDGSAWKKSVAGVDGAREVVQGGIFNGRDIGSPGWIPAAKAKESPAVATKGPAT